MVWIPSLQNEILFVNDMKGPGPGPINGLDYLINLPVRTYIITQKSTIEIKHSGAPGFHPLASRQDVSLRPRIDERPVSRSGRRLSGTPARSGDGREDRCERAKAPQDERFSCGA
jgi:hypothetical protein